MINDTHGVDDAGWIGVDLDGTLAEYHGWISPTHIGVPVQPIMDRVKEWLAAGQTVKIMTARVFPGKSDHCICRKAIQVWCVYYFGVEIPITHEKDHCMLELWDDRAIQIISNTGVRVDSEITRLTSELATLREENERLKNKMGKPIVQDLLDDIQLMRQRAEAAERRVKELEKMTATGVLSACLEEGKRCRSQLTKAKLRADRLRDSLDKITQVCVDSNFPQDGRMYDIAQEALAADKDLHESD